MAPLFDIVAIVLITAFVPVILFNGLKVFNCKDYGKVAKVAALVLFACEVLRFFIVASKFELGRIPQDDLKIGFVTFVSIFALFAAFMNGKLGAFFKKVFVLLAFTAFAIGICETRVYTLEADQYALIKGLYFLESGLTFALSLLLLKNEKLLLALPEIVAGLGVWLAYVGLSFFFIFYWNLSIPFDAMFFIEKGVVLFAMIMAFCMAQKINHAKTVQ